MVNSVSQQLAAEATKTGDASVPYTSLKKTQSWLEDEDVFSTAFMESQSSSAPSLQTPASDAVELAVGIAAFHDRPAREAFKVTLSRLITFLVAMDAPFETVMSYGTPYTHLEGYVGQNDEQSLRDIALTGNIRELGAAIYVPTDARYLQDVYLHTLCRISALNIEDCNAGRYSEIAVDGTSKVERREPDPIPGSQKIPSTISNTFRECPSTERTSEGEPLGLCITEECLQSGSCPCRFPTKLPTTAQEERLRIYREMGGKENIGLNTMISRYREVCKSMSEQYKDPFATMLYKYTLVRPGAGYLATARVGDKVKHLPGVPDSELEAMQARRKSGATDIKTDWTKAELDDLSIPLSTREWEYQNAFVSRTPSDRLDWNIGAKAWVANPDGKIAKVNGVLTDRDNFAKTRQDMGLRVFNSPSGTTDQTLQIGIFMGLKEGSPSLYDLRLGCIGYMLWAEHHSYDEMGVAGLPYGLEYRSSDAFNFTTLLGNPERGRQFYDEVGRALTLLSEVNKTSVTLGRYDFSGAEAFLKANAQR